MKYISRDTTLAQWMGSPRVDPRPNPWRRPEHLKLLSACIDFEQLTCVSLIRQYVPGTGWHLDDCPPSTYGNKPVQIVRADNVLYVPELLLQIIDGTVVPEEVIGSQWSLDFERERDFQGRTAAYRVPFDLANSDEIVCILANFYSGNFGHWITEELVKVIILEGSGFAGHYVLNGLPKFAFEFMRELGIADDRIIARVEQPTIYKSAVYTTSINEENALDYPEVYFALRDRLRGIAGASVNPFSPRIWMVRGVGSNGRQQIANLDNLSRVLKKYGFDMVDLGALPLATQIKVSSDAQILAGAHGAGFVHALFMQQHSMVIECFLPSFINPSIIHLCSLMRHKYSMLVHQKAYGAYPYGDSLAINCAHLELVLQGWGLQPA